MTLDAARTRTEELNIADCLPKAATAIAKTETYTGRFKINSISIVANRNPHGAVDLFITQSMVLKNEPARGLVADLETKLGSFDVIF